MPYEKIIKLLVAAGLVSEAKVEEARNLALSLKWDDDEAAQQSAQQTDTWTCICGEMHFEGGVYCDVCGTDRPAVNASR